MKTATAIAVIAVGAILAFAVRGHPAFLNIQVAGWVIIFAGLAGVLIPAGGYGWLRRRVVLRRGPDGLIRRRVDERRYPPYAMLNPGITAGETAPLADPAAPAPGDLTTPWGASPDGGLRPTEETVEEYLRE